LDSLGDARERFSSNFPSHPPPESNQKFYFD
jgi:hypothetical protein